MTRSVPRSRWSIAGAQQLGDRAQEAPPRARAGSCRSCRRGTRRRAGRRAAGRGSRWRSKSPTMPCTRSPGNSSTSSSAQLTHHRLGDVDGHVAAQGAGVGHRAQQQPRLGRGARAELDELGGARARPRSPRCAARGSRARCASGSTRAARRSVEQLASRGVVEVLGRQLLERPREPVEHVVGQRALVLGADVGLDDDRVDGQQGRHRLSSSWRGGRRRRSAGAGGGPSCGSWGWRRAGPSPTSRRAARGSACRRTPRSTRGTGARRTRDSRRTTTRSTPRPARCPGGPLVPGRRLLPLGLSRKPGPARAGEGVGLEPGDVDDRSVRVPRLCVRTVARCRTPPSTPSPRRATTRGARSRRPR